MPQANPNARAYLTAAEAAEADGNFALAGQLKALAVQPPEREGPDPEVVRLNGEIRTLENAGNFSAAGRLKIELAKYVARRDR